MRKIEERIAHLTRTVDELNAVVTAQADQIDRLTRRVEMLLAREADRETGAPGSAIFGDERPPHY